MSKTGNHGIIIPRDRVLLHRMYWVDGMTLPQMGKVFDVTHKSVERVMRELDIPRRMVGTRPNKGCIDCGGVVKKIAHPLTKNGYGTRCIECRRKHYAGLAREYVKQEHVQQYRKQYACRYHQYGAFNPTGERGWIRTSKALLRQVRKLTRNPALRGALPFPNAESVPEATSQT